MPSNRGIDYESITGPMSRSMGMVADHLLRAPQVQYRLNMERQRALSQAQVDAAQAENYGAQTRQHEAATRKTSLEADAQASKNEAMKWLQANDQTFSGLVEAGTVTPEQMNLYARNYATATGKDMRDTVQGLTALAQARKAALGGNPRDVATMTGSGAASVANQDSRAATQLATAGMKPTVLQPGATVFDPKTGKPIYTNPSAAAQREGEYETTTQEFPAIEGSPGEPATPAIKRSLLGIDALRSDIPANPGKPAVPAIPGRKVTTKRRIGNVEIATQSQDPEDSMPPTELPARPMRSAGKPLDADTAKALLQEVGGDKQKARELAKQRGYSF